MFAIKVKSMVDNIVLNNFLKQDYFIILVKLCTLLALVLHTVANLKISYHVISIATKN